MEENQLYYLQETADLYCIYHNSVVTLCYGWRMISLWWDTLG